MRILAVSIANPSLVVMDPKADFVLLSCEDQTLFTYEPLVCLAIFLPLHEELGQGALGIGFFDLF